MTCPGCQKKMEQSGMMALWVRPEGSILQYQTCPKCTRIIAQGGKSAERLTAWIEKVLETREAVN